MSQLYSFGSNGYGQLGLGHTDDCSTPQLVDTASHGNQSAIKHIATGGNHTLILLKDGTVLSCGSNEFGQCIHGLSSEKVILTPFPVSTISQKGEALMPVTHVTATWTASIFITRDQSVYVAGQGNHGELGLGHNVSFSGDPYRMRSFPPAETTVVYLSSCMSHTVAVLSNGDVYGWGRGRKGQLGEPSQDVWQPRKVEGIPFAAVKVACGKDFTSICGAQGQIHMLGPNKLDRFLIRANAPTAPLSPPARENLLATWGSILALGGAEDTPQIQAWGRNDRGQLPPETLPQLVQIAAGSEHCLGKTPGGQVLAWGWGEHGNCGSPVDQDGNVKDRWNVVPFSRPVGRIFAGCATSFLVVD